MSHYAVCRMTVTDSGGNILPNASTSVYQPGTTTPVSGTLYSDRGLTQAVSQPLVTDAFGGLLFYMANAQSVDLAVSLPGYNTRTISDVSVVTDGMVSTAEIENAAVTDAKVSGGVGMQRIGDTVLSVAATNITFSSIPGTYKHLLLVYSGRTDRVATGDFIALQFNGDTGADYAWQMVQGTATTTSASAGAGVSQIQIPQVSSASAAAGRAGGGVVNIPDYASTTLHKTLSAIGGYADATTSNSGMQSSVGEWASTAAITSMKLFPVTGTNLVAGTRATLYGLN